MNKAESNYKARCVINVSMVIYLPVTRNSIVLPGRSLRIFLLEMIYWNLQCFNNEDSYRSENKLKKTQKRNSIVRGKKLTCKRRVNIWHGFRRVEWFNRAVEYVRIIRWYICHSDLLICLFLTEMWIRVLPKIQISGSDFNLLR